MADAVSNKPVKGRSGDALGQTPSYDVNFFMSQRDGSYRSAAAVVPIILSLIPVQSVIDVGCGIGTWASRFLESGVPDVLGIDGAYVDPEMLLIPAGHFLVKDLLHPIQTDKRYDLAVCLEVAEHLPGTRSAGLVQDLVSLAPCVLFSAALPGQGGTDHVNERYLSYWVGLFSEHNYLPFDLLRPRIWNDASIEWWYRQNIVIFASREHPLAAFPSGAPDLVHPELYESKKDVEAQLERPTLGYLLRSLPASLRRSVATRWSALRSERLPLI
jgi:SAM-dependent methyltransferase